MNLVDAVVTASEAAGSDASTVSPYVFGAVGLGVLLLLLVVTLMINVDR